MNSAFASATQQVEMIISGQISSLELLEIYIERNQACHPDLNAIVCTDLDRARERAARADQAVKRNEIWGRLHGLPVTIKDNLEVVGMPCTAGSPDLTGYRPGRNAHLVQSLVDEGAIVFGKTNLPLFGGDFQTYNAVFGQTNNPWDLEKTPGGSSGGAAAALAAGLTALDVGNDIGGSIRSPAGFCGVYGHKPSFGIVPGQGMIPPMPHLFKGAYSFQTDIVVNGPMARSAADLDLALDIMVSPGWPDRRAWQIRLPEPRKQDLAAFRVGVWLDDPVCPVDSSVGDCLQNLVDCLAKAGVTIVEAQPPVSFKKSWDLFVSALNAALGLGAPPWLFQKWVAQESRIKDQADYQSRQIMGAVQRHREWLTMDIKRQVLREKWADYFKTVDLLLCPVTPVAAFNHDHTPWFSRTLTVNGGVRPYTDMMGWAGLTNVVYLPATVAPCGRTKRGLPVGVQILGPYLEDRTPIQFAKQMALVTGGFVPPPGYA
jgi:amidase